MHTNAVARVYAEALLEVAQKHERIDEIGQQLADIDALLRARTDVKSFVDSPAVDVGEKKHVLDAALRGRADDFVVNFLGLLLDKGRMNELQTIVDTYRVLADAAIGRSRVRASTAVPLPDDLKQRLLGVLRQNLRHECVLETEVQPRLLGGMVLTIGDKVYDGSVSGHLRRLQHVMMRSSGS